MSIVKDGQAPYAPASAVLSVIDGYRSKHPQTPFTPDNIQMLGVTASLAPRTIQALELLDLVDDQGEPTQAMIALREASNQEFPARLAEVVTAAYAEVFRYKDPAKDSPESLQEIFRFYRPPSMQPRMLRLFYGLCERAGLITEAPVIEGSSGPTPSSGQRSPARQRLREHTRKIAADKKQTPPPTNALIPPLQSVTGRPEIIEALVAKLPPKGGSWTAQEFDWWMQMMRLAAPAEYGFEPTQEGGS